MTRVTVTAIFSPASLPVSVIVDPTWAGLLLAELVADGVSDEEAVATGVLSACPVVTVWLSVGGRAYAGRNGDLQGSC